MWGLTVELPIHLKMILHTTQLKEKYFTEFVCYEFDKIARYLK